MLRLTTAQSPRSINRPTQQLASLHRAAKFTCRSHYCSPSSVFTGMLKIVITLVRTEIFNLDVFFLRVCNPAVARGEVVRKRQMLAQSKRGVTTFGLR